MIEAGQKILKTLEDHGYEAYFVGGFVRDFVLGKTSDDIDICTSATPEQVSQLFEKTIATGIEHGTVSVLLDSHLFEITTFRSDGAYVGNRKPESVQYGVSLLEDLKRRDFTINALVMDSNLLVHDYLNGTEDLKKRIIRTIGDARTRFTEDALRMLRAVRFQGKLGFQIEEDTLSAMKELKALLNNVSVERIKKEMIILFNSSYEDEAIHTLNEVGFPRLPYQFKAFPHLNAMEQFAIMYIEQDLSIDDWKFSNKEKQFIKSCLKFHDEAIDEFAVYEHDELESKIKVFEAVTGFKIYEHCMKIKNELPIHLRSDIEINGHDLLNAGLNKHAIGVAIEDVEKAIVYGKLENEQSKILDYVRSKYL